MSSNVIIFAGSIGAVLGAYFVLPWLVKPLFARGLARRVRRAGQVCLTFDDGPDASATPRLLDVLDAAGAKATFFLLGRNAVRHPELVRRIAAAGHDIGEHGFDHRHAWKTGPATYLSDLLQCRRALAAQAGTRPVTLYRPAFGEMNLLTLAYLLLGRRRLVLWNVNPRDFEAASAQAVAKRVADAAQAGSIILLHDAREDAATDAGVTVEAVRLILQDFKRRGLQPARVSAALSKQLSKQLS